MRLNMFYSWANRDYHLLARLHWLKYKLVWAFQVNEHPNFHLFFLLCQLWDVVSSWPNKILSCIYVHLSESCFGSRLTGRIDTFPKVYGPSQTHSYNNYPRHPSYMYETKHHTYDLPVWKLYRSPTSFGSLVLLLPRETKVFREAIACQAVKHASGTSSLNIACDVVVIKIMCIYIAYPSKSDVFFGPILQTLTANVITIDREGVTQNKGQN